MGASSDVGRGVTDHDLRDQRVVRRPQTLKSAGGKVDGGLGERYLFSDYREVLRDRLEAVQGAPELLAALAMLDAKVADALQCAGC